LTAAAPYCFALVMQPQVDGDGVLLGGRGLGCSQRPQEMLVHLGQLGGDKMVVPAHSLGA